MQCVSNRINLQQSEKERKNRQKTKGSLVKKKTKSLLFFLEVQAVLEGGVGEMLER